MRKLRESEWTGIRKAIRKRRIELGLSQQQLADMLGVFAPQVARWETKGSASLETLVALCVVFECGLDDLVVLR